MRKPSKPRPGKGQVVHLDTQQCDDPTWHLHDVCGCDPDVEDGNVRNHIKHALAGHWPLTPDQDIVRCPRCEGAVVKTSTHKGSLHYMPLDVS